MLLPVMCIDLTGDERFHDLDVRQLLVELRAAERARMAAAAEHALRLSAAHLRALYYVESGQ